MTTPTTVEPGRAYWVHVASASTFSPPLPRDDPTTRFVYDGDGGRVKQITAEGTRVFLGELVEQAPDGTLTKYVFAGSQRIASIKSAASPLARGDETPASFPTRLARWAHRTWQYLAAFLDIPTAEAAGTPTIRFFHGDHLGSTNLVTDGTGAVVERTEHAPFGAITSAWNLQPRGSSRIGFTGQREDAGTGLILFPARAYDPDLGRFLQPDPFIQDPADPQSLNRYAYARNNPVNFVDPSGYGWIRWVARIVGAVIGALIGSLAGPEGAYVGAVFGAAIGDSVGVAIERSREGTSTAVPADTGQRFWNAVGPPLMATGQQLSRAADEVQAIREKTSELSEEVWNEAQRIVAELGVSAGRAREEITKALVSPQAQQIGRGVDAYIGMLGGAAQMVGGVALIAADGPFPFADVAGFGLFLNGGYDFLFSGMNFVQAVDGNAPTGPNTALERLGRALTVKKSEEIQTDAQDVAKIANLSRGFIRDPNMPRGLLSKSLSAFSSIKQIIYSAGKIAKALFFR